MPLENRLADYNQSSACKRHAGCFCNKAGHRNRARKRDTLISLLTMSSGSSGNNVIVPEPSRSIFCLIKRIFAGRLCKFPGSRACWLV